MSILEEFYFQGFFFAIFSSQNVFVKCLLNPNAFIDFQNSSAYHYLQIYADKMHYSTSTLVTKQLRYCKKQKSSKISFTDCTFHPPNRFLEIDEKVGRKELKILCSHSPFLLTLLTSKNQQSATLQRIIPHFQSGS